MKPTLKSKHGAAMSFDEIAKELGVTRGAVYMLYNSAMRKLSVGRRLAQLEVIRALALSKQEPPAL